MGIAKIKAERLLEELELEQLPIIPETVCQEMSSKSCFCVTIQETPMDSEKFHGISMGNIREAKILINANIPNRHRKRFTAAHEIGHVVLHIQTGEQSKFQCSESDIYSGDSDNSNFEKEANEFASSLLMPESAVYPIIHKDNLSWSQIEEIQRLCDVSLEAAARKVVALSKESCCLIIHRQNEMWSPIKSQSFGAFISKQPFPNSLHTTSDSYRGRSLPNKMEECDFMDWTFPDKNCIGKLWYSSIHNTQSNRTMTLLLHDEDDMADDDYEDEPRFC